MILLTMFLTLLIFSFALAPLILNNAVYAVLCFISVFLFISCILLSIGIEFLAFVYAIVYIGAVAVLFLFVVMLLQVSSQYKRALKTYWIALLIFCVTMIAIKILKMLAKTISISVHIFNPDVMLSGNSNQMEVDVINSTSSWLPANELYLISHKFYNVFGMLFMETAFMLLLALIAVIILTKTSVKRNI